MLDTFQRYKEAYRFIEEISTEREQLSLLDVGSNGAGFATYNYFENVHQTNIDIAKFPTEVIKAYPHVNFLTFNGYDFPFSDQQFDITISSDTLEHVPPQKRERFITQILRITNQFVIFTFPVKSSTVVEKLLYYGTLKISKFLKEHIEYGLPCPERFQDIIEKSEYKIIFESQNLNRQLWIVIKLYSSVLARLWKRKSKEFIILQFKKYISHSGSVINSGQGYSKTYILAKGELT